MGEKVDFTEFLLMPSLPNQTSRPNLKHFIVWIQNENEFTLQTEVVKPFIVRRLVSYDEHYWISR